MIHYRREKLPRLYVGRCFKCLEMDHKRFDSKGDKASRKGSDLLNEKIMSSV